MDSLPTAMPAGQQQDQAQPGWECRQVPGLSPIPYEIYETVRARVIDATRSIVEIKNLPARLMVCVNADTTVELLHFHALCAPLLAYDPSAIEEMQYFIDNHLDALAIREAALAMAQAQGVCEAEVDWVTLTLWTDEAFIRLRNRVPAGGFYRWEHFNDAARSFADLGMHPVYQGTSDLLMC